MVGKDAQTIQFYSLFRQRVLDAESCLGQTSSFTSPADFDLGAFPSRQFQDSNAAAKGGTLN